MSGLFLLELTIRSICSIDNFFLRAKKIKTIDDLLSLDYFNSFQGYVLSRSILPVKSYLSL